MTTAQSHGGTTVAGAPAEGCTHTAAAAKFSQKSINQETAIHWKAGIVSLAAHAVICLLAETAPLSVVL